MQRRTALVAAALSGVLAGVIWHGAPAQADGPPRPGSITTTIDGVPAHVAVGGSFSPTLTVKSESPYKIEVEGFFFSLANTAAAGSAQGAGIEVRWKDPASGTWRLSTQQNPLGVWTLSEPSRTVWIQPHGTVSIRLYITMNGGAARGTDVLSSTGICAYSLFDTSGANVSGTLEYNRAESTFFFGAASNGTAPGATPPQSAAAVPGATGDGDGDADDPPGESPGFDADSDASAIPLAPPAPVHESTGHAAGFSTPMPLTILMLVAAVAFGCGALITRRRGR